MHTLHDAPCSPHGAVRPSTRPQPAHKRARMRRVRDFEVIDAFPFGIQFSWERDGEQTTTVLFERNGPIPAAKMLTFFRCALPQSPLQRLSTASAVPATADSLARCRNLKICVCVGRGMPAGGPPARGPLTGPAKPARAPQESAVHADGRVHGGLAAAGRLRPHDRHLHRRPAAARAERGRGEGEAEGQGARPARRAQAAARRPAAARLRERACVWRREA